jgi:hypothetical protein
MRTSVILEEDVLERAREVARRTGRPLKRVVNEAARTGLPPIEAGGAPGSFRTVPRAMVLRPGVSIDNVQEALARLDDEAQSA